MSEPWHELAQIVAPAHSAVLVIDMQNDFCSPDGAAAKSGVDISMMEAIVPGVAEFLKDARKGGVPVVFVQGTQAASGKTLTPAYLALLRRTMLRKSDAGAMFGVEGTWGAETVAVFERRPNEPLVIKHRSSAFVGTGLHETLRKRGVRTVIVVGEQSCGCVEATIRHAADLDYYPVVVRDLTAAFDADLHDAAILTMSRRWWAPSAAEVVAAWREGAERGAEAFGRPSPAAAARR